MPSAFRPLLDALGSIAVLDDLDNHVVEMNGAAERFTGYRSDELRGRIFWRELIAPEDAERYRSQFGRVTDAVLPRGYETWWRLRDGRRRLVIWTHRPLRTDGRELVLTTAMDITDRRGREERLQYLAFHDELTGLPNRRRFLEELDHRLASARRYGEPLAVLMMDVDRLKRINDRLGHEAGDELLCDVATRVRSRLRASDVAARLGGDEFAVLLSRADRERAEHIADGLVQAVAALPPPPTSAGLPMAISVGVAAFPADAGTTRGLLRVADQRLYIGRGRRRRVGRPSEPDHDRLHAVVRRQELREERRHTLSDHAEDRTTTGDPNEEQTA